MCFTAINCPKCENGTVFPTQRKVIIDGEVCFIFSVKCGECGWQPSEEHDIAEYKKYLSDPNAGYDSE